MLCEVSDGQLSNSIHRGLNSNWGSELTMLTTLGLLDSKSMVISQILRLSDMFLSIQSYTFMLKGSVLKENVETNCFHSESVSSL